MGKNTLNVALAVFIGMSAALLAGYLANKALLWYQLRPITKSTS